MRVGRDRVRIVRPISVWYAPVLLRGDGGCEIVRDKQRREREELVFYMVQFRRARRFGEDIVSVGVGSPLWPARRWEHQLRPTVPRAMQVTKC